MPIVARVDETAAPLAPFDFHWDAETEILAGRADAPGGSGFTGAWELEGPDGAVATLETSGGVLSGIEVVVWPDVEERGHLVAPHDAAPARLMLEPPAGERDGVLEIEMPIAATANPAGTVIHLTFGSSRARAVRLAPNVLADLDDEGHLVGVWLLSVPPFPQGA